METPNIKNPTPGNLAKFDRELIFGILNRARRKLSVTLARGGPQRVRI